jgi:hypothetical protein
MAARLLCSGLDAGIESAVWASVWGIQRMAFRTSNRKVRKAAREERKEKPKMPGSIGMGRRKSLPQEATSGTGSTSTCFHGFFQQRNRCNMLRFVRSAKSNNLFVSFSLVGAVIAATSYGTTVHAADPGRISLCCSNALAVGDKISSLVKKESDCVLQI